MKDRIHAANRKRWDAAARRWAEGADSRGYWKRCPQEPELVLCAKELEYLGDISGKRVCVLGSGDNQVVFALAGLGAAVTSVDISQNQLDIAAQRSKTLGLGVSFVRADVTNLSRLADASFDVVYTGGHVAVWVADLAGYYSEAARILRPNGLYIVNEYHPFRRIWQESGDSMIVEFGYLKRGPFEYDLSDDILRGEAGPLKSYEFHWTVADYLNATLRAGCRLLLVDEYGEEVCDWEGAPMHGLPEFLLIIARKNVESTNPCDKI
ncbi:MAG: class I SAM-dependent methyltransferase [Planctomycetes bacterium]|nr:class I SAM-dependent methyltransferase [Planctomycetota bacterium]